MSFNCLDVPSFKYFRSCLVIPWLHPLFTTCWCLVSFLFRFIPTSVGSHSQNSSFSEHKSWPGSPILLRRFYNKGYSHKTKQFNTTHALVSLHVSLHTTRPSQLLSVLFQVSPGFTDKTGLHSFHHSLSTCHATRWAVMLFRSNTLPV